MRNGVPATPEEPQNTTDRDSLCFACPEPDVVLHAGQPGFHDGLLHLYEPAESKAAEQLVKLKDRLRRTKTEHFFEAVTEGLAQIFGAQYAFVSKRIVVDDENVAVEMPPIGEPGACLMGAAFYVSDGHDIQRKIKNFKYHAYSCPCAYMKHDKIFIIPERLNEFIPENPNVLAIPGEAYLGVPLCAEGKCFAHFGVMWSPEGAANRRLRWSYMEMICHALEDMILDRLLEGKSH
ncbi:putative sensor protein rcsc [Diplodia seriata]|uniref:Putative sensor protein rcsc n=1 Tax=Diplodia seriata TaxID=420778 RepID=A0A0G2EPQ6_9PEZI|nr:putative sensor protein rcsc [Diplodia seriata]